MLRRTASSTSLLVESSPATVTFPRNPLGVCKVNEAPAPEPPMIANLK